MRVCGEGQHRRAFPEPHVSVTVLQKGKVARNTDVELECVVSGRSSKRLVKTMLDPGFCVILDCVSKVCALSYTQVGGIY